MAPTTPSSTALHAGSSLRPRGTGDKAALAFGYNFLGTARLHRGDDGDEARRFYDQCEPTIRQSGNKLWLAVLLANIGEVGRMEGDYESALRYGMESLALFRETED